MDKKSLMAIVLITVLVIGWMIYMSVQQAPPPPPAEKSNNEAIKTDTAKPISTNQEQPKTAEKSASLNNDSAAVFEKYGASFAKFANGSERIVTIENDLMKIELSSRGAVLHKVWLKKFKAWDQIPTQLVWTIYGELGLSFFSRETGRDVDTRQLYFNFANGTQDNYLLKGNDKAEISLTMQLATGKSVTRKYTFYAGKYHFDADVEVNNLEDIFTNKGYRFEWSKGIRYQELNSVDESTDGESMVSVNGEMFYHDAAEYNKTSDQKTGLIDFAAIKSKYFTAAIMPNPKGSFDGTVQLTGQKYGAPDHGNIEKYAMSFIVPYRGGTQTRSFRVYTGPIDYDIVEEYGLQNVVSLGWKFIVRPIGEFFMLPFFMFIYKLIGNFGISIILFSIVMKILLHPLSIQQMRSAQKMQILAPELAKVREQYKDDQQKQQQETMKLYSSYGINPAGGCLPLLLQMPILYALWSVLKAAIDLRQANFALWITDLSLPDSIFTLPFPILGISSLSGLAIAMGATMFIQQKMTITDPKQKALVYMMPIMFTLMFSNFPSGLNLYYFMFNLLGILQQVYMNKFSKNKLTLADLKRMPKKEGWIARKMREAQEIAASQGRTIPGQKQNNPTNKPQAKGIQKKKK
jgi:YidC/Oxa1 family membrane protein insertase